TLQTLGEQGEIDLLVERFVRRPQWEPPDNAWEVLSKLARKLAQRETRGSGKANLLINEAPFGDFRLYRARAQPETLESARPNPPGIRSYLVRGEEVAAKDLRDSLVASTGTFRAAALTSSAVFAGGSVNVDLAGSCVIVCDGDFTARQLVHRSIVMCALPR